MVVEGTGGESGGLRCGQDVPDSGQVKAGSNLQIGSRPPPGQVLDRSTPRPWAPQNWKEADWPGIVGAGEGCAEKAGAGDGAGLEAYLWHGMGLGGHWKETGRRREILGSF